MTVTKGYTYEDYAAAIAEHGSISQAARALGLNRGTMSRNWKASRLRHESDPGVVQAADAVGITDLGNLHSGWLKTKEASLYFQMPRDTTQTASIVDTLRDALADVPRAKPAPKVSENDADLLTVYPIADAHIGMLAWRGETGEDYDTRLASARVCEWMGRAVAAAPASHTALILDVGDTFHADDQSNLTPQSKHQLDTDTRYFKTLDVAIWTMVQAVDLTLAKHAKVIVSILKGNHDPHASVALMFALAAHYRDEPRVEVQKKPGDFFVMEFGSVLIAAQHGDKAKADRLVMFIADQYAAIWGRTKYRYLFTGHLHHHKSADIGGMVWEQLNALTARDHYAFSRAFIGRAQLSAITYHKDRGVQSRAYVNA